MPRGTAPETPVKDEPWEWEEEEEEWDEDAQDRWCRAWCF